MIRCNLLDFLSRRKYENRPQDNCGPSVYFSHALASAVGAVHAAALLVEEIFRAVALLANPHCDNGAVLGISGCVENDFPCCIACISHRDSYISKRIRNCSGQGKYPVGSCSQ